MESRFAQPHYLVGFLVFLILKLGHDFLICIATKDNGGEPAAQRDRVETM